MNNCSFGRLKVKIVVFSGTFNLELLSRRSSAGGGTAQHPEQHLDERRGDAGEAERRRQRRQADIRMRQKRQGFQAPKEVIKESDVKRREIYLVKKKTANFARKKRTLLAIQAMVSATSSDDVETSIENRKLFHISWTKQCDLYIFSSTCSIIHSYERTEGS
ncbi:hypothetical protein AVEN_98366-1 [Araneus ventricosus]|uniref:Uncharacterized protein n=1 Tax=Araneus ventricosus TaxID=182803 RepID=A0A4Y2W335_ARAVE|nr:hypothetical protein AVEN_98366-1 [Araneus ventricosus]